MSLSRPKGDPGPVVGPRSCFPPVGSLSPPQGESQLSARYSTKAVLGRCEVVSAGWMIWTPDRPEASTAEPAAIPASRAPPAIAVARTMTTPAVTVFARGDPGWIRTRSGYVAEVDIALYASLGHKEGKGACLIRVIR